MSQGWVANDLSTDPPVFPMGHEDEIIIPVDATEAVTEATAKVWWPARSEFLEEEPDCDLNDDVAYVTINGTDLGLRRGEVYELQTTFVAPGKEWVAVTFIEVQA